MTTTPRNEGRPLHALLVAFPAALLAATLGLELAHLSTQDAFFYRAAMIANFGGVLVGALASIPGVLDLRGMPRGTRARTTGDRHALVSALGVLVFAASAVVLYAGWRERVLVEGAYALEVHVPLALGMVGLVLLASGGLLGYAATHAPQVVRAPVVTAPARPRLALRAPRPRVALRAVPRTGALAN